MSKLLCFLTLWATCATAQTVEGSVIDSATGRGLAGVRVGFLQGTKTIYDARTDAQGHFGVEGVKDGTYSVRYTAPDYWPSDPGTPAPFQANMRLSKQMFQVVAGGNPVKLEAHMTPLPRITGRVVDGRGRGVPDARMELTGLGQSLGSRTDGEGRFDIHQFLLPGVYTLSAAPPPGIKPPDQESGSDRVLNWTRTYYPGVSFPEAASKIILRPGGEVWDIELKLLAVPAHAVRGVLLKADGTPAPKIEITLGEGPRGLRDLRAESKSDGTFEIPAVVDGAWSLLAEAESEGADLEALQWIEMAGHDIEGVKIRLSPPFKVRGNVVMERREGMPPPRPPTITLSPRAGGVRGGSYIAGPS
jgi:5-hydroxyisourate hydrolase-like protein (transthyretin family)